MCQQKEGAPPCETVQFPPLKWEVPVGLFPGGGVTSDNYRSLGLPHGAQEHGPLSVDSQAVPTPSDAGSGGLGESRLAGRCQHTSQCTCESSGPVQAEALRQHGGFQVLVLFFFPEPLLLQQGHQGVSLFYHFQHLVQDLLLL